MKQLTNEQLLLNETLLATSNGYIGVRSNFEEGYPDGYDTIRGAYINGFYDEVDIKYGEIAYGFPEIGQKICNVMDPQNIQVSFGGTRLSLFEGEVIGLERQLLIEEGFAIRKFQWLSPDGHRFEIIIKRMTSFDTLELFTIDYEIKSLDYTGPVTIEATVKGDVKNYTNPKDPRVGGSHGKLLTLRDQKLYPQGGALLGETNRSKLFVALTVGYNHKMVARSEKDAIRFDTQASLEPGQSLNFIQYAVFTDSIRHEDPLADGYRILERVMAGGIARAYDLQKRYLNQFWAYAKLEITGEEGVDFALNYSVYALLASAGKDNHSNISAKGLSGEGYEGHYFWDTEIYMIPFFTLTNPTVARNLLRFRHTTLDFARERAKELGHKMGAKIPWRTIKGTECSGYFPAGCAQYHINGDVAYATIQYYLFTKDMSFMVDYGLELLYETARIWLDMGHYSREGAFMIHDVTGPDEYTAIVNNNYYTNAMAKYHLTWTARLIQAFQKTHPKESQVLYDKIAIKDVELAAMERAAAAMYLPFDEALGINLQDDSFMDKEPWDFVGTPKDHYPLLLHYHPLAIYRHKVLKQADTVLAHMLLDNESEETILKSYEYYEQFTTHDSSLSPCVYGIMASRINQPAKAYDYFMKTLKLDLDNLHHNTKDGLHIANAGGAYMSIVYGFGGVRIKEDGLHLRPTKPQAWDSIRFRVHYGNALVTFTIGDQLLIETTKPIELFVDDVLLKVRERLEVSYHGKH